MRKVFVAANPIEAGLVRDLLVDAGIPALVQGEALWAVRGEVPATADTLPSVWVPDGACEQAHAVLRDLARRPGPDLPPWNCQRCDAEVDGEMAECWNCGTIKAV